MRDSTVISIEAYREQRTGLARAVRAGTRPRRAPVSKAAHRPRVVRRWRGGLEFYRVTCSCRRFVGQRYTRAEAIELHHRHLIVLGVAP